MKLLALAAATAVTIPALATAASADPSKHSTDTAQVISIRGTDPRHDMVYTDRGGSWADRTSAADLLGYRIKVVRTGDTPHVRAAFNLKRVIIRHAKFERVSLVLGRKGRFQLYGTVGDHRVRFARYAPGGHACPGARLDWSSAKSTVWMTVAFSCLHAHGVYHRSLQPSTQLESDIDDASFWDDDAPPTIVLPFTRVH